MRLSDSVLCSINGSDDGSTQDNPETDLDVPGSPERIRHFLSSQPEARQMQRLNTVSVACYQLTYDHL